MTDDADDVKNLLGRAFGQEPPLRIDRDEVIGQGRKRLRRKRFFEAGTVVAAVVVAAVGAATLTNLTGSEPDRMPPAASSSLPAPPSPSFPPSDTTSLTASPTSASVQTTQSAPVAVNRDQLTSALYSTGVVSVKEVQALPGHSNTPEFKQNSEGFVYEADVFRRGTRGFLQIMVGSSINISSGCSSPPAQPSAGCEIRDKLGSKIVVNNYDDGAGQRHTTASVTMPNGMRIYAMATNLAAADSNSGGPVGGPPVLTADELCVVVTKVGSSV